MECKSNELPEMLPSQLLELALRDLEAVEQLPDYCVDMSCWHTRKTARHPCLVCLAGSVMANTLGMPLDESAGPGAFSERTRHYLEALEDFRCGCVTRGVALVSGQWVDVASYVDLRFKPPHYLEDPVEFKATLRRLVTHLREEGK